MSIKLRTPIAYYLRKSDSKSDLARQRDLILAWCKKNEVRVPEHLRFEDTGSRDKSKKRVQFQKMMAMVRAGEIGTVLIQSFERFGIQDSDEFFEHRTVFQKSKAVLYSIDESEGNLTDKETFTLLKIIFKAEASRDEQKKKGERAISGKHTRIQNSKSFQGGPCPFGYDKQTFSQSGQLLYRVVYNDNSSGVQLLPDGGRVEFHGKNQHPVKARFDRVVLVPSQHANRIAIVEKIFDLWVTQTISINAIARHLNAHRLYHYSRPWCASSVRQILGNAVYIGSLVFNRQRAGRFAEVVKGEQRTISEEERGKRKLRPRDEWIVIPDTHAALVDAATFETAQLKLGAIGYGNRPPRLAAAWLKGLAFCGRCGRCMVGRKIGGHVYLVCDTRKKQVSAGLPPTCEFNSIRHDRLEVLLSTRFDGIVNHGKDRETLAAHIKQLDVALDTFLTKTSGQETMFAEMMQRIAEALGIEQPVTHSHTALRTLATDHGVSADQLKQAQVDLLAAWDAEVVAELDVIVPQLETLADKWLEASGVPTLADRLKTKVKTLEARRDELEARKSVNILKAYQATIEDFQDFVDRCRAFRTTDNNLAKAEALRAVLSKIVLKWVPKSVKGKSRLDGYDLVYCGDFADHATA